MALNPRLTPAVKDTSIKSINSSIKYHLGNNIELKLYFGGELSLLNEDELYKIAKCYMTVFNESWGESWTLLTALNEIKRVLFDGDKQKAGLCLLYDKQEVVGFSIVEYVTYQQLEVEHFSPKDIPPFEKQYSFAVLCNWIKDIMGKESLIQLREVAILKDYRGKHLPHIMFQLYNYGLQRKHDLIYYWTNTESKGYKWGVGCGMNPIYISPNSKRVIVCGKTNIVTQYLKESILSDGKNLSYQREIDKYFFD